MEVFNLEAAYRRLLIKLANKGLVIRSVTPINHGRYMIVRGDEKGKKKNLFIMYKRDVFRNFGRMFRDKGYTGVGDTINKEDLKSAIRAGVTEIYSIFPNGKSYKIGLREFLLESIEWTQKEGKEVRSISIHAYEPFGEI